jgi:hypothetical protein
MLEISATFLIVGILFVLCLALALAHSDNPRPVIPHVLHRLAFLLAERVLERSQGPAAAVSIAAESVSGNEAKRTTICLSATDAGVARSF